MKRIESDADSLLLLASNKGRSIHPRSDGRYLLTQRMVCTVATQEGRKTLIPGYFYNNERQGG